MATTVYFDEKIVDQGGKISVDLEIGRSSFYPEDSIYLTLDGKTIIMDRVTAKKFVDSIVSLGVYHGLIE